MFYFPILKTILILTRYPSETDLKDGYFQRVSAVDTIFSDCNRFYINYVSKEMSFRFLPKIVKIKDRTFEIRLTSKNYFHGMFVFVFTLILGRTYSHSILPLGSKFHRVLFLVSRRRILDVHGVVPEEFAMHGDLNGKRVFNKVERIALQKADVIIVVTESMKQHLIKKYHLRGRHFICLPIFSVDSGSKKDSVDFKKNIIYCGGLQKWQQVDKMLAYVWENKEKYQFTFLVPDPIVLEKQYQDKYGKDFPGIIKSGDAEEVARQYKEHCFGLVLREDIIVNKVACPTKLIEYLQNYIVPIVDSAEIGDFKGFGYKYVDYKNELPNKNEWVEMIDKNRMVLIKFREVFEQGKNKLRKSL